MSTFEVTTDLIIHCKVRVSVEADDKQAAVDAVAELMPNNFDAESRQGWRASVHVKAPKDVRIAVIKAYHFEQASGADKAKKVSP